MSSTAKKKHSPAATTRTKRSIAAKTKRSTSATAIRKQPTTAERAAWQKKVRSLVVDVKKWARLAKWPVAEAEKIIAEEELAPYPAPVLRIRVLETDGEVRLDPIGVHIYGTGGRVDLYAWPSHNRVRLMDIGEGWQVYTDSNIKWPKPWGRDTFLELARELAASR